MNVGLQEVKRGIFPRSSLPHRYSIFCIVFCVVKTRHAKSMYLLETFVGPALGGDL